MAFTPIIPFVPLGVLDFLRELKIREEDIEAISSVLHLQAGTVEEGTPDAVAPSAFGSFPAGSALAHHTAIAHQHVADAMKEMVTGLQGYGSSVRAVAADFYQTDDEASLTMRQIQAASEGVLPGDFHQADGDH